MEFHRTDAPRAHENEFFELYYLESYPIPILPLRPPNPYTITHAGLAIRSTISEKIIVLEYLPINEQIAYLPLISSTLNGSVTTIQWNQNAVITQAKFINESYWKRSIYLTRINNVVYHKYLDWVDDYIFSHSLFIPYTVCLHATAQTRDNKKRTSSFKGSRRMSSKSESDGYPPPSTLTCPFQKQTWDTFIIDSFNKLSEFAVTINPITPLYHMNWIYYSKYVPDRVLLEDDPSVIPYFTQLVSCMKGRVVLPYEYTIFRSNSHFVFFVH